MLPHRYKRIDVERAEGEPQPLDATTRPGGELDTSPNTRRQMANQRNECHSLKGDRRANRRGNRARTGPTGHGGAFLTVNVECLNQVENSTFFADGATPIANVRDLVILTAHSMFSSSLGWFS
jgi:hypothetical protein